MKPTGILNLRAGARHFQVTRYAPTSQIAYFVERYWIVRWNVPAPYVQENIPHPCINLAVEAGQSGIFGIPTGKFTRHLQGAGWAFGVKFKPGAFYPFWCAPITDLNDQIIPIESVFGAAGAAYQAEILSLHDDAAMVACAEAFLAPRLPAQDPALPLIYHIIACIIEDRTLSKVDDLVQRLGVSKRSLQRLFQQYVGLSPKAVIQLYRLHDAAEQLAGGAVDGSRLALELGYFDQAHFIKAFKNVVGKTPADYAKLVQHPIS